MKKDNKRLTDYIIDFGRTVAYHPGLKGMTGSTSSTVLLCQFLYWIDKTNNAEGWIYKTSDELEEETGLTYYEQKTARRNLVGLGFIEEKSDRLHHTIGFRIMIDAVNDAWDKETGSKTNKRAIKAIKKREEQEFLQHAKIVEEKKEEEKKDIEPDVLENSHAKIAVAPVDYNKYTRFEKKGDLVDGTLKYADAESLKKENELDAIKEKIDIRLHLNADGKRWMTFIEFAWKRQKNKGEKIDTFIDWVLDNGFSSHESVYWTPARMMTVWPQAFVEKKPAGIIKDWVKPLPPRKPDDSVPMPRDMGLGIDRNKEF